MVEKLTFIVGCIVFVFAIGFYLLGVIQDALSWIADEEDAAERRKWL